MSSHCRMGPVNAIFLCWLVRGMGEIPSKPSRNLDLEDRLLPPRSSDFVLSTFLSGLQHNHVDKHLPGKDPNQHVKIYRNALKKHILGRSDVIKKSGDSLEERSDPSSLLSTLLLGVISLTSSILRHNVAALSMLMALLVFPLVLGFGFGTMFFPTFDTWFATN